MAGKKPRKIGVSNICLAPFGVFGEKSLKHCLGIIEKAGYGFLQLLPTRGFDVDIFNTLTLDEKEKIWYIQRAWNAGSFLGVMARALKLDGENQPLLHDWLLFGKKREALNRFNFLKACLPEAKLIGYSFNEDELSKAMFEINPEHAYAINSKPSKIWSSALGFYRSRKNGVILDTENIMRKGRHGEPPIVKDFYDFLEFLKIIKDNVSLIQVKNSASAEMLIALNETTDCPVVFEDAPPVEEVLFPSILGFKQPMINWLKERKKYLNEYFYFY